MPQRTIRPRLRVYICHRADPGDAVPHQQPQPTAPLRRNIKLRFLPVAQYRQHDRFLARRIPQHLRARCLRAIDSDDRIPFLHTSLRSTRPILHVHNQNAAHLQLDPDRIPARNQIVLRRKY